MVIEAALAGAAEWIVTGDEDMLILESFETVRFVTPRIFLHSAAERQTDYLPSRVLPVPKTRPPEIPHKLYRLPKCGRTWRGRGPGNRQA